MQTHKCPTCGLEKLPHEFRKANNKRGFKTPCAACYAAYFREYRARNKEKLAAQRKKNADFINAKKRAGRTLNPGKDAVQSRKWRAANAATLAARKRRWHEANKGLVIAGKHRRKAAEVAAVPPWFDSAAVQKVYLKAAEWSGILGHPLHVDHVVPLRSPLVCGLHTHSNLQLLAAAENVAKGNRYWPDMPQEPQK